MDSIVSSALETVCLMHNREIDNRDQFVRVARMYMDCIDKQGFVFDFDLVWSATGYSRKDHGKNVLMRPPFVKGQHYTITTAVATAGKDRNGGQNKQIIMLTREALRMFVIVTKTQNSGAFLRFIESVWTEADTFATVDANAARRRAVMDAELGKGLALEATQTTEKSVHDQVADRLAVLVRGTREAVCDMGRVDVLTDAFAIEVKPLSAAMHGLGQALGYAHATGRRPWVHLFDDAEASAAVLRDKTLICSMMKKHGVKVTFEVRASAGGFSRHTS
jgi:hypothetical protein